MTNLLVFCLAAMILYNLQIVKPMKRLNKDYLSLETCGAFRGLFALVVVYHHLALNISGGVLFHQFTRVGYLVVAIFFFYSGYGLMKKHITSPRYYEQFLIKRIPTLLIPYLIASIVYWIFDAATGTIYTCKDIMINTFLRGSPIVPFSWYIIAIIVFYVAFWMLMLVFKQHYGMIIICECFLYALYVLFCHRMGYDVWWYQSAFALVVGMIWAYKETYLISLLEKNYFMIAAIAFLSFCLSLILYNAVRFSLVALLFKIASACLFSVIVVLFSMKFIIGNKMFCLLGKISLEIYMFQGIPISFLCSKNIFQNEFLWCISVLLLTIVIAIIFHLIFNKVLLFYRRIMFKATPHK